MAFSIKLLVAGLSAVTGKKVMTQTQFDEYKNTPEGRNTVPIPLRIVDVFKESYQRSDDEQQNAVPIPSIIDETSCQRSDEELQIRTACTTYYQVFVHTPSGEQIPVIIYHCSTVADLKRVIAGKIHIPTSRMRPIFSGRQLNDDDKKMHECSIKNNSNIHVLLRIRGGGRGEVLIFDESDLAPEFHYDFSTLSDDGKVYYRGPHKYCRPYGWERFAIKVVGKYENDNWLGEPGMRTNSTRGEWSVSYHGTSESGARGIIKGRYKMGTRFLFGKGIYSSPVIAVAEQFATQFSHNGHSYLIVFQNRCDPNHIKVIPGSETELGEDYWITENEEQTRPYGICFKQVGSVPEPSTNSPSPDPIDPMCTIQ